MKNLKQNLIPRIVMSAIVAALLGTIMPAPAQIQRLLGLDVSAHQSTISQTVWNNLRTNDNRQFTVIRSSRGGTTGEDHRQGGYPSGDNTYFNLSERYDDPNFVQNVVRATSAGIFVGSYHFSRPDVVASTANSGGIANNGTDEADHFIQMAGPWMRPGYLVPMHDLEAGETNRTDDEMAQFCIDFANRIYNVMGIRPGVYVNGNYAANILQPASVALRNQIAQPPANVPSVVAPCYPVLWTARWPNQTDPNSIDVQNTNPKDTYSGFYGPWDDYGGPTHPWKFWQYASTAHLASYSTTANLDVDVANGGIEFLKDQLIPAVWMNDASGDWSTLTNWNSGQTPIAPPLMAGQLTPTATGPLPTPRLPGAAGTGPTSGQNDTVILERPNTNITVTLSTGTHNIRKLYMRETLIITNGSLTINYVPSADSTTNGAQFSGPVTLAGTGNLSVHTLQVDTNRTFTLGGGALTFNTIKLMPHSTTPAKILVTNDVSFSALSNVTAVITNGTGSGSSGFIDLGGGNRSFNVANGAGEPDVSVNVPVSNGSLTKTGSGTMRLSSPNTYTGGTTVSAGTLLVSNTTGSGTGTGLVTVNGGILSGTGAIGGGVAINSGGTISPGTSAIGTLTVSNASTFTGTNFFKINRNGGVSLADKLVLANATLNYSGTFVISNVGLALIGGEVFTNFQASTYSGAFANTVLPILNNGLNWYLGKLTTNGTIKVNRSPVPATTTFTNEAPNVLQIPLATLTNATDADGDAITLSDISLTTMNGVTITTNDTYLFYSNYVSVADQISYVISDGHGGSATGAVNIASSPTGRFAGFPSTGAGSVTNHFVGRPDSTYYVERSTNLPVWLTISTNIAPSNGIFDYVDDFGDLSEPPSAAFYRLRWLP